MDNMNVTVTEENTPPPSLASFSDDFSSDTISEYAVEDSWTKGGTGSFSYDSGLERARVLTGDNIALKFSHGLPASAEGSFSIDFLPGAYYPSRGWMTLKLIENSSTYYLIENVGVYGAGEIAKYVNGVKVDSSSFSQMYSSNVNYTINVTFSANTTTVEAFGETLVLNSDTSAITVSSFSIEVGQQDAYFDNIVYRSGESSHINIITPKENSIQSRSDLIANVLTVALEEGWGVKFVLDEGGVDERILTDTEQPYEVTFSQVSRAEHSIDVYIIDNNHNEVSGEENHDRSEHIAIGDILIAMGDSITFGYGDTVENDNVSVDLRNTGGGFEPILNNYLTDAKGYPHSIINEGIEGETTQEGLERLPSVLAKYPEAGRVLLLYGTNNTSPIASQPLESGKGLIPGEEGYAGTYKDYMQQMIDLVNASGKTVAVAKLPVALGTSSSSGDYEEPIDDEYRNVKARDFNEALDELVEETSNHISIVPPDLYTYFRNNYETEFFDNLHPNGVGYQSMADLWRSVLLDEN
jgi:lysophospholipase L1-like esterase